MQIDQGNLSARARESEQISSRALRAAFAIYPSFLPGLAYSFREYLYLGKQTRNGQK